MSRISKIGHIGEDHAAKHLLQHNYEIIDRNYALLDGEIDIIARKDSEIVFVEVKTQTENSHIAVWEMFNRRQQRKVARMIELWLMKHGKQGERWRLDFIAIVLSQQLELLSLDHLDHVEL